MMIMSSWYYYDFYVLLGKEEKEKKNHLFGGIQGRVLKKNLTGIQNVPETRIAVGYRCGVGVGAGSLANLIAFVNVLSDRGIRRCIQIRHSYAHLTNVLARRALPSLFVFVDRYRPPVRNVLSCVSARLANVRRNNGVSCRARAYWMTHFNDDNEDENDNEDDDEDVTLFMILRNENKFTRE